jgi:hypothetical protein
MAQNYPDTFRSEKQYREHCQKRKQLEDELRLAVIACIPKELQAAAKAMYGL